MWYVTERWRARQVLQKYLPSRQFVLNIIRHLSNFVSAWILSCSDKTERFLSGKLVHGRRRKQPRVKQCWLFIENYQRNSNYGNINFALETRAIAQMKGLLILIKIYKNTFVKNEYLTLFWVPKGRNWPENHEIGPIYNLDFAKSINAKA